MKTGPVFSSRMAAIFTMIGMAVGLANVWRFPYMMGQYGGAAFFVIYLFLTVFFAIPGMMAELSLGRFSGQGPISSFEKIYGNVWGRRVGSLFMTTTIITLSYYGIVLGHVFFSALFAIAKGFSGEINHSYNQGLANFPLQLAFTLFTTWSGILIIHFGLKKGIERVSNTAVPIFLILLVILVIHTFTIDGARAAFMSFIKPDFNAIGPQELFAAIGQSLFSLGMGGTILLAYGSFVGDDAKIPSIAGWTATGDIGVALLSSLFLMPVVLVYGLNMTSGPTLLFETLPELFSIMPGGRIISALFLSGLSVVALLSLVAGMEVVRSCLIYLFPGTDNRRILIGIGALISLLAIPSLLDPSIIGILDLIFGSGAMILGSLLAISGFAWMLKKETIISEVFRGTSDRSAGFFHFWIRWVIPISLGAILITTIYQAF
jgi:NSS family neurotransmitter:Na+ symporter